MIEAIASHRMALHEGHTSSRPLSEGYESVGLHGEFAFGEFCGVMPDISDRPSGDAGVDFVVPMLFTVDVKTARKANNLIHEAGKPLADIYVLAEFVDNKATLVGWEWGSKLAAAPVRDFGYGVQSHYIPREQLKPLSTLACRLWRVR